ncbi:UDP-glycosyltransferase 92A1 [Ipomoea triloba]|uniref:UDP-glycosyltransferase 92A1 n=1 Tax=Ipomoea triloba TaxID=35885 RepID=UPI00125D2596|nr:UDP-glycosyltransferase 92A1 [Ipomoea triloba]
MEGKRETIILFPFMAQGHITPFLALSFRIAEKGSYNIILVNTPLNIKKLRSSLPPKYSSIRLLEIPFDGTQHGLPPDAETADILPYYVGLRLLELSPSLEPAFRALLSDVIREQGGLRPLCVVADFFFGWTAAVAREFGIFHAIFSGAGAFGLACFYSMWLSLPHRDSGEVEFTLPDFPEAGIFHVSQLSPSLAVADGADRFSVFQRKNLPTWADSNGLLLNTIAELENNGLVYFRRKLNVPVWAIGPILLSEDDRARIRAGKEFGISPEECTKWLDKKPESSVLYISFGSQSTISATQMMQLAKALDSTDRNFIWVIRPPLGFDPAADFSPEEWLPEGFIERVKVNETGLIVLNWAPQVEILAHSSIAAFLSHCGWNSVLESLCNGVALIGWPMAAEQFFNAKLLGEEVGVCVEVARGTNFEVRWSDIVEKIEMVMGENEKGKEIRRKAMEVKEIIRNAGRDEEGYKGSSVIAMEEFLKAAEMMKERAEIGRL